jgi:hypothetical protein
MLMSIYEESVKNKTEDGFSLNSAANKAPLPTVKGNKLIDLIRVGDRADRGGMAYPSPAPTLARRADTACYRP